MPDDDEIIKKIREASQSHRPAYDDASWNDMLHLLDKHLPEKKNKRRFLYLILLFLIPVTGMYIAYKFKSISDAKSSSLSTSNIQKEKVSALYQSLQFANTITKNVTNNTKNISGINSDSKKVFKKNTVTNKNLNQPATSLAFTPGREQKKSKNQARINKGYINATVKQSPADLDATNETADAPVTINSDTAPASSKSDSIQSVTKSANADTSKNKNISPNKSDSNISKKTVKHFKPYWVISITTGPDVSAVKLNTAGKVTLQYGVQAGYVISPKFTLRTGFLISKKLYTAAPEDYHSQGGYNNYYLKSIDADCNVYEIPLTVSYDFTKGKKSNWYVSTGLSSYLMKRESYDYFYEYPTGVMYSKNYVVSNKNQHYFSIVDLSAGYERIINKKISLSAEPYIKLPFTGIGVGKIKLNSAGVLFSLNVKLF